MKTKFFFVNLGLFILFCSVQATEIIAQSSESVNKTDVVTKIKDFKDFYQYGNFYLGGQPNLDELRWAKDHGVKTIINLRSNKENKEFSKDAFSEADIAQEMSLTYISIPVKSHEDFNEKTLSQFATTLSNLNGKVLVHCKGGERTTFVMMAYLIKYKNFTKDEAITIGKKMTYFSPLDALLGNP